MTCGSFNRYSGKKRVGVNRLPPVLNIYELKNLRLGGDLFLNTNLLEGLEGLEPSTRGLRGRCSNQLSYRPSSEPRYRLP
jgi:hypothetical protein